MATSEQKDQITEILEMIDKEMESKCDDVCQSLETQLKIYSGEVNTLVRHYKVGYLPDINQLLNVSWRNGRIEGMLEAKGIIDIVNEMKRGEDTYSSREALWKIAGPILTKGQETTEFLANKLQEKEYEWRSKELLMKENSLPFSNTA